MIKADKVVRDLQKRMAKTLREASAGGMTVTEIARKIGVTEGTVRHWKWSRTGLRLHHLIEYANVVGVSPISLIFGDDAEKSPTYSQKVTRLANALETFLSADPQGFAFLEKTVEHYIDLSTKKDKDRNERAAS